MAVVSLSAGFLVLARLTVKSIHWLGEIMRLRTTLATALAASGLGLSALVAAPAQAATQSFSVDCASGGSTQSVTATTGDTITLSVSAGTCQYVSVEKDIIASSSAVSITGGGSPSAVDQGTYFQWTGSSAITGVSITLTITGPGQINFTSSGFTGQAFNISSGGGGGSSSSTTSGSAPATVVQQFGMPATGTCDEAQPEGLNWSGVANGGWGVSWAQWMNGGTGGAVCTRTLVYSTIQSKWVVN